MNNIDNIIRVAQPIFFYSINDPTKVQYGVPREELICSEPKWKEILVQTYAHGLPEPAEYEILFSYAHNRGYLLKLTKSFNNWLHEFK